jgi:hypothetical protein
MFGIPILEVAIGLCFVYLLLSLICSAVNETIAGLTQRRGKMLEQAINNLVGDLGITDQLYKHPIIKSLMQPGKQVPSYIPSQKFALALMDIVTGAGKAANDSVALRQGVAAMSRVKDDQGQGKLDHLQGALSAVLSDSQNHLKTDQQKIQAWYDDAMERVSGWYKRRTTLWIWGLALLITVCINADTVRITKVLWTNQAVRSAVVDAANARAHAAPPEPMPLVEYSDPQNPQASSPVNIPSEALTPDEKALLGQLMIGWQEDLKELKTADGAAIASWVGLHVLGWFLTIVALSLGAPFWFDMLNKFINLRNSGQAPAKAADTDTAAAAAVAAAAKGAGA